MTETSGATMMTYPHDLQAGIIGGPMHCIKLRLKDIPSQGYFTTDANPKGEICVWGPQVTPGYFKNPEKTQETFHNGWLMSGDVGLLMPNGAIKVIDRAKNIFKLS